MSGSKFVCDCTVVHHEVVDDIKKSMIDVGEYKKLAAFFKVFADETRIKILWALDLSEMCVCDICSVLDMSKSAVSHQLASLRKEHLVKYRREGKSVYYSLDDEHVKQVFETGLEHIRHFNENTKSE
jgi:cadmium efflux system accessory protein